MLLDSEKMTRISLDKDDNQNPLDFSKVTYYI